MHAAVGLQGLADHDAYVRAYMISMIIITYMYMRTCTCICADARARIYQLQCKCIFKNYVVYTSSAKAIVDPDLDAYVYVYMNSLAAVTSASSYQTNQPYCWCAFL